MLYAFNEILISKKKKSTDTYNDKDISQLKNITLSKRGQREKRTYCRILVTQNSRKSKLSTIRKRVNDYLGPEKVWN